MSLEQPVKTVFPSKKNVDCEVVEQAFWGKLFDFRLLLKSLS